MLPFDWASAVAVADILCRVTSAVVFVWRESPTQSLEGSLIPGATLGVLIINSLHLLQTATITELTQPWLRRRMTETEEIGR
jgi:hypothetical protein